KEIKFRLRDQNNKIVGYEKWYPGVWNKEQGYWTANSRWLYSKDGEKWNPDWIEHRYKDQFTGIKDKKGNEVWEGDIVEQEAIITYPGKYGGEIDRLYIGEVVILASKGVCLKKPKVIERDDNNRIWYCSYYINIASYRSKIIGDICSNPELVEK
ncbi:unnamed protein product, partial [marine sediment metagenome]